MGRPNPELPLEDQPGTETIESIVLADSLEDEWQMHSGEITRHQMLGRRIANMGMLALARNFEEMTKSIQVLDD